MISQLQIDILMTAMCLWREARGELETVKIGVACVIRNRVKAHWLRDSTYQDVCVHPRQFSGLTEHGDPNLHKWPTSKDGAWLNCLTVAESIITGQVEDVTNGAVFYHDVSMSRPPEVWGAVHEIVRLGRIMFTGKARIRAKVRSSILGHPTGVFMPIETFLSDKRLLSFLGALLVAVCGWGLGFARWSDMFTPNAIFGLMGIVGSLILSNVTNNIFKTPPVITQRTEPEKQVVTVTTTTSPAGQPGAKP